MVFYEAPHKLSHTLADLYQTFGDRRLSIVRELTKVHEQVIRTTLKDAVQRYAQDPLKGELVLIIEGKPQERPQPCPFDQALLLAQEYTQQGMSTSEAAKTAAKFTGLKKGDLYKALQNGKQP